jgi:hypothetical protein
MEVMPMSPRLSNAVRYLSESRHARLRRARKPIERVAARRNEPRPARGCAQADAVVAPHPSADDAGGGCAIPSHVGTLAEGAWVRDGADLQVLVEQRRVTLISRHEG